MTVCRCGHPRHHHHHACATTTITGPATNADDHAGRTVTACTCLGYEAQQ